MVRLLLCDSSFVLTFILSAVAIASVTCFTPIIPVSPLQFGSGGLQQSDSLSAPHHVSTAPLAFRKNRPLLFGTARPLDDHHDDSSSGSSSRKHGRRGSGGSRGISSSELRQMNQVRRRRLEAEAARQTRYVSGDDLHELRREILKLHGDLHQARQNRDLLTVSELERTIFQAQQLDAEFMYQVACERMQAAQRAGRSDEAREHSKQAMDARLALPQFTLQGLWVGKYSEHGFEMINVTYVGDTLVARKVTGDRTVPKGEVSFTVNLSPTSSSPSSPSPNSSLLDPQGSSTSNGGAFSFTTNTPQVPVVEPIELGPEAAQQWGTKYLQRFAGQGQVASEGFTDSEWLDGQLILVGQDYFSFAWLPIGHQVFFGRPSPELTLKLLRESRTFAPEMVSSVGTQADPRATTTITSPPEIVDAREHLRRCLEETESLEEEMEANGGVFGPNHQLDYYSQEGCFE